MTDNTKLWTDISKTDPKHTKDFNRGGGFKGTSINPTYNNKRLTEQFGMCGIGWGFDIVKEEYVEGGWITDKDREIIHVIQIDFWFFRGEKKGIIPSKGQTTFVGKNKFGVFTDEEAPKKSLTDAITKAASYLGFGADIFMGMYDDVKYVNDLRAIFGKAEAEKEAEEKRKKAESWVNDYLVKLSEINKEDNHDLINLQTDNTKWLKAIADGYPDLHKVIMRETDKLRSPSGL